MQSYMWSCVRLILSVMDLQHENNQLEAKDQDDEFDQVWFHNMRNTDACMCSAQNKV